MEDLPQIVFEWFVSVVWDRHGPLVGILAVVVGLGALVGAGLLAVHLIR